MLGTGTLDIQGGIFHYAIVVGRRPRGSRKSLVAFDNLGDSQGLSRYHHQGGDKGCLQGARKRRGFEDAWLGHENLLRSIDTIQFRIKQSQLVQAPFVRSAE
ncbi:hypothetical protein D9M71_801670 [compost metagenome]